MKGAKSFTARQLDSLEHQHEAMCSLLSCARAARRALSKPVWLLWYTHIHVTAACVRLASKLVAAGAAVCCGRHVPALDAAEELRSSLLEVPAHYVREWLRLPRLCSCGPALTLSAPLATHCPSAPLAQAAQCVPSLQDYTQTVDNLSNFTSFLDAYAQVGFDPSTTIGYTAFAPTDTAWAHLINIISAHLFRSVCCQSARVVLC